MSTTFKDYGLPAPLVVALETRNLTRPFPIQI
jgi:superfamily II DNA/RNA helicase